MTKNETPMIGHAALAPESCKATSAESCNATSAESPPHPAPLIPTLMIVGHVLLLTGQAAMAGGAVVWAMGRTWYLSSTSYELRSTDAETIDTWVIIVMAYIVMDAETIDT